MLDYIAKSIDLNTPTSKIIIKFMVKKGWSYGQFMSDQSDLIYCLKAHIDIEELAREESRFVSTLTLTYPGEHSGSRPPGHRASERTSEDQALVDLLEAADQRVVTEPMTPFQENSQNTWIQGEFPTTTQLAEEHACMDLLLEAADQPDVTKFMTSYVDISG